MNTITLTYYCKLFEESLNIHTKRQYIPKIRDYFIPYLEQGKLKEKKDKDLERSLRNDLSMIDIVEATKFYVRQNENVTSQQSVRDFLISVSQFILFLSEEGIENPILSRLIPFKNQSGIIIEELELEGIYLQKPQQNPPINEDEFRFIIDYCNKLDNQSITEKQTSIIVKLLLFLGLKYEKIIELRLKDFDYRSNTLKVKYYDENKHEKYYEVHLPYRLSLELAEITKDRDLDKDMDYLFKTIEGNPVKHGYMTKFFKRCRETYLAEVYLGDKEEYELEKNHFTPTGLLKYAVIQMIKRGVNQSIITEFTGIQEDIFRDCQNEVNSHKVESKSRYLDSKLRSIETFDLL